MRALLLLMLVGFLGLVGCASGEPRSEPSPVVEGSAGLPEPGEQGTAEPETRVVSAPEITTTPAPTLPPDPDPEVDPEDVNTDPEPAQSAPAPAADGPPSWYRESAWIVENRLMVAAVGEAGDVLEARRAAVRAGRAMYAIEAGDRGLDPEAGVIIRTALLREDSIYRAYVLVTQPAAE